MKNFGILNKKSDGDFLFEIDFIPKGSNEEGLVGVYARNSLDASNYLILNHIWGDQRAIRVASSNLLK